MDINLIKSIGIVSVFIILLSVFILLNINTKKKEKKRKNRIDLNFFRKNTTLIIVAIIIINIGIQILYYSPMHIMYTDEPSYIETSNNLIENFKFQTCELTDKENIDCSPYYKASGWVMLISAFRILFGFNSYLMINSIIKIISAILIFHLITNVRQDKSKTIGFTGAILFSILPIQTLWSSTLETNSISVLFVIAQIFFLLSYIKYKKNNSLISLSLLILISLFFRIELIFMLFASTIIIIKENRKRIVKTIFNEKNILYRHPHFTVFCVNSIIILGLIIIEAIGIKTIRHESLSISLYLLNMFDFTRAMTFNYILIIPIVYYAAIKKDKSRIPNYLLLILTISVLTYLPLYTESRVLLIPSLLSILLFSVLISNIKAHTHKGFIFPVIIIVLICTTFLMIPIENSDLDTTKLQTSSSREIVKIVPDDCLIITAHVVNIKHLGHQKTISISNFVDSYNETIKNDCIYFYEDAFCVDNKKSSAMMRNRCRNILSNDNFKEINEFTQNSITMRLFEYQTIN